MKNFGKLSPNTELSASLVHNLFYRPHEVLNKLRAARNGEIEEVKHDIKLEERMNMGNQLEEIITQLVQERLQLNVKYPVDEVMSIEIGTSNDNKPLDIFASLDAISYVKKPHEVKSKDRQVYTPYKQPINLLGPVPIEIKSMQGRPYETHEQFVKEHGRGYLQCLTQMIIADAKYGIVGILFNGNDLRVYVVTEDPTLRQEILGKALVLYDHLENDTCYPPVDIDTAAALYPKVEKETVDVSADYLTTINDLETLLQKRNDIENAIADHQMKLIEAVGEAEIGILETQTGGRIELHRPIRHYKAQPPKYSEAKEARTVRAKTVSIKRISEDWS
jgi:hypothetical protein|tara:strand:+ start:2767 stop:3768 length:1002 start_codon:yes stop_codon:yes gene_type:complete